ncbi:MAG: TldD/PmbA family protein [bacterium]|nr:TldD/PmbA family protein [bacterium]
MIHSVARLIEAVNPSVDFWSARIVENDCDEITVRQNTAEPVKKTNDIGIMINVFNQGGAGYSATSDLSLDGIEKAFAKATAWAKTTKNHLVYDLEKITNPINQGEYKSFVEKSWDVLSFKNRIELLKEASLALKINERIVDWSASLWHTSSKQIFLTSNGTNITQEFNFLVPNLTAIANENSNTQLRTLHGRGLCRQGGLEVLDECNLISNATIIAEEAMQLLYAENCPSGKMDLLLDPDQMLLQIHESIGHPIELDRILGDERNYAGTSFVTLDMFGKYQYGSDLLNVTYDPTLRHEFASYAFDDDGVPAKKEFIIKDGILERPLGGLQSQSRGNSTGVANSRASNWNRPAIDRMANLNLEPGNSTFADMVKNVEKGVFMKTNSSWSIDDSRNKFQFGCEWARLIENGELTKVVRNPNYRGISETFWRNLKMVGNNETFKAYGSPFCGKGEPNQCIRVGHASPACLFKSVDVFGGAE